MAVVSSPVRNLANGERTLSSSMAIQLARSGVPAGCLSVACRYVHTQSEMVDVGDTENTVALLLETLSKPIEI